MSASCTRPSYKRMLASDLAYSVLNVPFTSIGTYYGVKTSPAHGAAIGGAIGAVLGFVPGLLLQRAVLRGENRCAPTLKRLGAYTISKAVGVNAVRGLGNLINPTLGGIAGLGAYAAAPALGRKMIFAPPKVFERLESRARGLVEAGRQHAERLEQRARGAVERQAERLETRARGLVKRG